MTVPPEFINILTEEDIVEDLLCHIQNRVVEEEAEAT